MKCFNFSFYSHLLTHFVFGQAKLIAKLKWNQIRNIIFSNVFWRQFCDPIHSASNRNNELLRSFNLRICVVFVQKFGNYCLQRSDVSFRKRRFGFAMCWIQTGVIFLAKMRKLASELSTFIHPNLFRFRQSIWLGPTKHRFHHHHCLRTDSLWTKWFHNFLQCIFTFCSSLFFSGFSGSGNAQRKRLSVSTATKMKLNPWLYRDNFCISAKSMDQISCNRKLWTFKIEKRSLVCLNLV